MAKKGVLGNGTHVWIARYNDAGTPTLTRAMCISGLVFGDDTTAEVDNTCLEAEDVRTNDYGLSTPGEGSVTINTDPKNESHLILIEAAENKEQVGIYAGWSDGIGEPKISTDGKTIDLPSTRTWSWCEAIIRKNSVVLALDALNNHTLPFKRQTKVFDEYKPKN